MPKLVSTCELLTTADLAERLKISVATARRWRHNGKGPNYVRLGHNDVRYRLEDVDAFLKGQTVITFGGGA
ncbi:helix-turn-helix domain-containing protein [Corynebacterium aurimucosum]|uniref:helix-turn-helix transcriptional regulator n=1 Tax=Corynebacterium guaraldiae TaxID=3051103 RepID=UPI0012B754D9|nr:helix-turn-helix domain-containing protein [Corynebacterium guaraldiae]MTE10442.1 helix-turn-helix domain-containing protein [Corynebacterium guaraldiae]